MQVVQFQATGAGFRSYRSRCALLEGDMAAASLTIETASDIGGMNRAASGANVNASFRAVNLDASGTGMSPDL